MENLRGEQAPHLHEAMPDLRTLPFGQAKNTAFTMEHLSGEQAPHLHEAMLDLRMLPPQQAQKHRICNGASKR